MEITGRATDFGVGGCYVDTMNTFAEGTPVEVLLHWQEHTLRLRALVSYAVSDRSIGMGLAFTETSAEAGATLLDWVTGLGRHPQRPQQRKPEMRTGSETRPSKPSPVKDAVDELVALLVRKQLLTESEVSELRKKIAE